MKKLTRQDFEKAAKLLNCSVAAIRAVSEVESRGAGFYTNGFPVILFERHKFYKYTKGKFAADYPEICNSKAGGYGKPGDNQRRKFNLAFSLDPEAAMMSCSWGKFQIMGFNFRICGFNSVGDFVDAMKRSEGDHLLAFCSFVKENRLDKHLRSLNWAKFAEGYNGSEYRKNRYDEKMAAFYAKFSKEKFDAASETSNESGKPATVVLTPIENTAPEALAVQPVPAGAAVSDQKSEIGDDEKSAIRAKADKFILHCKTDSAKNIALTVSARIGASIGTLWGVGIHGKLFLIIISLAIIGFTLYAFFKYRARFVAWIKAVFESIFS